MKNIQLNIAKAEQFLANGAVAAYETQVKAAMETLEKGNGAGNDFLGWVNLPTDYDKEEFARIKKAAEKIRNDSDILIVIGIGGSYLGARAAIEMLSHSFYNTLSKEKRNAPQIFYAGNSISSTYLQDLLEAIDGKDFSVNVISKSGTLSLNSKVPPSCVMNLIPSVR